MASIDVLHPLIVPRDYTLHDEWDLPYWEFFNGSPFVVCWVEYGEAMLYLDRKGYNDLQQSGLAWQQLAVDHVRQSAYFNHYRHDNETTGEVEWIAFVNDEDTISSSKVLLQYEVEKIFRNGYEVAIPDRACGVVLSKTCRTETRHQVQQMVHSMYAKATVPMSPDLFDAAEFRLPADWVLPLHEEPTGSILKLFESSTPI